MTGSSTGGGSWLRSLGLHRPELRAWAMYDWANSAFVVIVITAVFPIYFQDVAAADLPGSVATARFALGTTLAVFLLAVLSPLLGAAADYAGIKKRMLAVFMGMGLASTALLAAVGRGDWFLALAVFVLGNIGLYGSLIFYDSLLPHIASGTEMDRVSTAGYAIGYLGGGLLLAFALWVIQNPQSFGLPDAAAASRAAFAAVAVWWGLFSLPLFLRVSEPPRGLVPGEGAGEPLVRMAFSRLTGTFRELRPYRQAVLFLAAFLIYNDGVSTIYRMATIYGREVGVSQGALIAAIVMVQFLGIPFTFAFGALAGKLGARGAIFCGLGVYILATLLGYFMTTAAHFFLLAFLVSMVQGGTQALSRSLFATLIPRSRSAEFFAFFGVFEKFAGVLGPASFAGIVTLTGSSRYAVLAVAAFFLLGGLLLMLVKVEEGQKAAREAERRELQTAEAKA